jgi:hypothetical protein
MYTYCIDPGLRGVGLATFAYENLVDARYVKNPADGRGYKAHAALAGRVAAYLDTTFPCRLIIEHPRVYPGMPKTDPNDLLDVVAVGAACAAMFERPGRVLQTVLPSEWKGTVKKQIMLARIMSRLTVDEQKYIQRANKSDMEDVLDAIGIGLWFHKRLNLKNFPGATP